MPATTRTRDPANQWLVLEPNRIEKQYWKDMWRYRELIRPFLTMVVFTVIFGRLAKLPSEGDAPYAILVFAAMLPWQFFSTALSSCSESLISNANLLT